MEQFQLTDELIKKIADLILAKKNSNLKKLVNDIHFADMADIINLLNEEQGVYLIKLFDSEKTSEILTELDENVREKILKALSAKEIAVEIKELDSVKTYYKCSNAKAEQILKILTQEQLNFIKSKLDIGGRR